MNLIFVTINNVSCLGIVWYLRDDAMKVENPNVNKLASHRHGIVMCVGEGMIRKTKI